MKLQEKLKKEVPPEKLSNTIKKFAKKIDALRVMSKNASVSFCEAILEARKSK